MQISNRKHTYWVPLYRHMFSPHSIPFWIRKQMSLFCYREQFPIDLSRHISSHRGQGQTWKDRLVSVDLGLQSPNNHIPPDIRSVRYLACTRTNALRNLAILPNKTWETRGIRSYDGSFIFTVRAYARAVLGVVILSVCPSVRPSVTRLIVTKLN